LSIEKKEYPSSMDFQRVVSKQAALIEKLRAEIAILKKNSATSSKPPSSDIVKPTKLKGNAGSSE